jgi:hypothetical protein
MATLLGPDSTIFTSVVRPREQDNDDEMRNSIGLLGAIYFKLNPVADFGERHDRTKNSAETLNEQSIAVNYSPQVVLI